MNNSLDSLFSNVPANSEEVTNLPSNGKLYPISSVRIRPMTFADEKAMASARRNKEDAINTVLSRCVTGATVTDLVMMDKLFLLFKLRELSYGDTYSVLVNCTACNSENKLNFKLSNLPVNYLPDGFQTPIEVELPATKLKVKLKLPRVSDERFFLNEDLLFDNLWRFIVSIADIDDPVLITSFLKDPRLPLKDIHKITKSLSLDDYGVQTKVKFSCVDCKVDNVTTLPITSDFFTMS